MEPVVKQPTAFVYEGVVVETFTFYRNEPSTRAFVVVHLPVYRFEDSDLTQPAVLLELNKPSKPTHKVPFNELIDQITNGQLIKIDHISW